MNRKRQALTGWVFPGQGSQTKGMGHDVFDRYPDAVERASEFLGWDVQAQCELGADPGISNTRYLQPALYLVECLLARAAMEDGWTPDIAAGHSLGEYAALQMAGAFDLFDGLELVRARGELMAAVQGGAMTAVIGLDEAGVEDLLARHNEGTIDIANINSHEQVVVAGPADDLVDFGAMARAEGVRIVPLAVCAAFHSRYMEQASKKFGRTLASTAIRDPLIPVIANTTARVYERGSVRRVLEEQMRKPVRWWHCQAELRRLGVSEVYEVGPGQVLSRLWEASANHPAPEPPARADRPAQGQALAGAADLGSSDFQADYGVDLACVAGSMFRGISSVDLVARMGEHGMLGFYGSGGVDFADLAAALDDLNQRLGGGGRFGLNLISSTPEQEARTVGLALNRGVRFMEVSSFTRLSPDVIHFRFSGAQRTGDQLRFAHHVILKASRPEVAEQYLRPAPAELVQGLVSRNLLTQAEADLAAVTPIVGDLCVEADSGGHTDGGNPFVLLPAMQRLRDELAPGTRIGLAGGLGDPDALAAAFLMGADFVVTGSVNQATVEAGTSEAVKDLLTELDISDTTLAPAGDLFELGAQVRVVRKRTLFPARANKLLQLARAYECLDDLPPDVVRDLQERVFKRTFDEIWTDIRQRDEALGRSETNDPRARMMKTFRWYFAWTTMLALDGDPTGVVNYQVHCGPAMGALNRFLADTSFRDWRNRHVDEINRLLMGEAAQRVQAARTC